MEVILYGRVGSCGTVIVLYLTSIECGSPRHTLIVHQWELTICVGRILSEVVIDVIVSISVFIAVIYVTCNDTVTEFVLETRCLGYHIHTEWLWDIDTQSLSALAAFGRDHDRTVQTAGTIEGCGRRSLQYGYRLEVIRVQVFQLVTVVIGVGVPVRITFLDGVVQDHAIDHIDRLVVLS